MRIRSRLLPFLLAPALLQGCTAPVAVEESLRADPRLSLPGPDYRAPGPHGFTVSEGRRISPHGCDARFTRYAPDTPAVDVTAVLAHGFLRDRATLDGLARHLAGWGIPVVSVGLCESTLLAGHHDRNADTLRALARGLGVGDVIHAGFSAGGLSALLAAAADPTVRAALLLDPVDDGGLVAPAAGAIAVPVFALVAPPSSCNRDGNAVATLQAAPSARVLQIAGASHCHFEVPLDAACTALCGGTTDPAEAARIQGLVLGLATAAVLAGAGFEGRDWWHPGGAARERLVASGRVHEVR